jgi:hypothetical protein
VHLGVAGNDHAVEFLVEEHLAVVGVEVLGVHFGCNLVQLRLHGAADGGEFRVADAKANVAGMVPTEPAQTHDAQLNFIHARLLFSLQLDRHAGFERFFGRHGDENGL